MSRELPKTFDPAAIEAKWYAHWEENGLFRPHRPEAEPFTIVNPPPNVTGSLHIGHALDNTLQDIVIRYERLRGKDALWVVGVDHAGIATQMVVERNLASQGVKRTDMSREQFVEHVWEWKEQSGGQITRQLRRLGCSMDWSREQFTMDPHFSRAVIHTFVRLYNEGLIYRDKRLVNWDPKLRTAISDLEVETREVAGSFWRIRYPLEDGVRLDSGQDYIEVATTRPETMLADMAVAVHPSDERYASVVGKHVILPITGRRVPVVADEHADPKLGSGAVKITPGHDFNDFEVGKRAGITPADMLNMLDTDARVVQCGGIPDELLGLDRFESRERVVSLLKKSGHLVPWIDKDGAEHDAEPRVIATPYGDRGGVVIEPWLTDQWYVDAEKLAQAPIEAVRDGRIEIVPKSWEKTFFNWMENIQPWCVSRQLWWGHRIPAWFGPGRDEHGLVSYIEHRFQKDGTLSDHIGLQNEPFVAPTLDEAITKAREFYGERYQIKVDNSFPRATKDTVYIVQDEDVLDTWFSSALWPFATLGWPDADGEEVLRDALGHSGSTAPQDERANNSTVRPEEGSSGAERSREPVSKGPALLQKHYPNSLLISGFDILFFWDARMMMMGTHLTGEVPWPRLYLHGLVRAPDGQKMSKSKGNVVDPLGLIERYGADALRFFMAAMESQGRDIKIDESRIEGYRNFATKLWNAARFCQANGIGASQTLAAPPAASAVNRWIIGEVVETLDALDKAMAELRFDAAANTIYHFVWDRFCDWYLELIKPVLSSAEGGQIDEETKQVAGWALDQILVMLHPFMPFVTEELWHAQGKRPYDLILAKWPEPRASVDAEAKAELGWVIGLIREIRGLRASLDASAKPMGIAVSLAEEPYHSWLKRNRQAIFRLVRADKLWIGEPIDLTFWQAGEDAWGVQVRALADMPNRGEIQLIHVGLEGRLDFYGQVDVESARARLTKTLDTSEKERQSLAKRLENPSFVAKAAPQAVEKARADHAHHAAEVDRLEAALARLG